MDTTNDKVAFSRLIEGLPSEGDMLTRVAQSEVEDVLASEPVVATLRHYYNATGTIPLGDRLA